MNTPYGIFDYTLNNFCAYLAYQTNTNFSYVKQKKQIIYIDKYMSHLSQEHKLCFIYEHEYIDKNYIDDFTSYYVNCFTTYRKTASRIHFFKYNDEKNLKEEFLSALSSQDTIFTSENYLGFIVIRPIPKTFLGKVCLKPFYEEENNRLKKYYLLKKYKVSLFGISLVLKSIAFQEQDKVLSACATTSLWSFYHAHLNLSQVSLPSSSEITKSSYPEVNGYLREFPNNGLSTEMICRSIRNNNLVPEYFEFQQSEDKLLEEIIYAYTSSNIPLILGVSVSDENSENKGLHAVTILGYSIDRNKCTNLIAHGLEKIYVHDDRYGPFIRMINDNSQFKVQLDDSAIEGSIINEDEIYTVDTLILGLYHKIRIPYIPIKNTCFTLCKNLIDFIDSLSDIDKKEQENFKRLISNIQWDISIKENADLKNELLTKNLKNKDYHLTKSLPKYLWSTVAIVEDTELFQCLFDATDIENGNVFIDYLEHHQHANAIYKLISKYSKEKTESSINHVDIFDDKDDNYINGIINYFNKEKSNEESLDETFGYLKLPELIRDEEIGNDDIIKNSKIFRENFTCTLPFSLDPTLDKESQYIWVIDQDGFLCIGIENEKFKTGHPTLTNGMPARIGGEIKAIKEKDTHSWKINSKSRRYSSEYSKDEANYFLKNALKYKFETIFNDEKFEPSFYL